MNINNVCDVHGVKWTEICGDWNLTINTKSLCFTVPNKVEIIKLYQLGKLAVSSVGIYLFCRHQSGLSYE